MAADNRLTDSASPEELARRLRDAHRRVRALAVSPAERARFARRLLAICEVSKRDIPHAATRLSAFLNDLDALPGDPDGPEYDTPSRQNIASGD
ncbi:hypothetical protein Misp01_12270 [Microtetraspora sp. NBRC 13810]|uniref:hypothetical protein n=1 Tax=Microtetraspora sp. NBRC 13810 TaxID=3030990 RepID=UPI0024A22CF3|nr:hypothetical protein [Microtetraspora sp. NBRC 13810]GLW06097.1 hypothetical protein Misp01_12270 [Microtetraspora sp. NBRC 13810]